ncbi:MAG: phospholipid carrier-dependent glycosyltransferase, partial [Myxococcota bacterium]
MKEADPGPWTSIDTVAVTVLLAMAALLGWRTDAIGPTVDEPLHLVRGLAWWWTDSTRLSFAHPPLANLLQAAPAWFVEPIDLTSLRGWDDANHAMIATQLVETHYDEFRPLLMAGRRVTSALGVGLALAVYTWTSWRFGRKIGLVALLMVAFNPTVLAHAQLVTTDLPVTLAIFVVTAAFVEYLRADATNRLAGALSLAVFAVAVAVALCTKFTALALVPLFAIIGVVWAIRGWGRFAQPRRWRRLGRLGLEIATVAGVSLVGLAAVYRFEDVGLTMAEVLAHPEPQLWLTRRFDHG